MFCSIVIAASVASLTLMKNVAANIREMTPRRMLTEVPSEEETIDTYVRDIYVKYGLLTRAEVGDEAAYDFIVLLTSQPLSLRRQVMEKLERPGGDRGIPQDAVMYLRSRYRLDRLKEGSKANLPLDPRLRDEIDTLYKSDQAVRQQKGFDPKSLEAVDQKHAAQLQTVLNENGIPTFAMVGPEAAGRFVTMIQHQPAQMRTAVLPLLRAKVEIGQADPESYALVYDLSQVDKGKKQLYGERLVCRSGRLQEAPIEDYGHVDQRRADLGLVRVKLYAYLVSQAMPQMCSDRAF